MSVVADRHLLFSLIALQVGLIDQSQLVVQRRVEEVRKHLDDAVARLEESCRLRPDHVRERASLEEARKARAEATTARSDRQGRTVVP